MGEPGVGGPHWGSFSPPRRSHGEVTAKSRLSPAEGNHWTFSVVSPGKAQQQQTYGVRKWEIAAGSLLCEFALSFSS